MSNKISVIVRDHQTVVRVLVKGPNIPVSGGGGFTKHSELTLDDGTNPHSTTKADVGLSNVPNTDFTTAVGLNTDKVGVTTQISNLLEDTTPQLGGALDLNGKSVGDTPQTATGDGATLVDWRKGVFYHFQFGAFNETFTFTNPAKAGTFILKLIQDGTGSRTATFPASVKWIDGTAPTLTTTATTGTDIITLYFDGTNYYCVQALNFS